jgi:hypothetical protein
LGNLYFFGHENWNLQNELIILQTCVETVSVQNDIQVWWILQLSVERVTNLWSAHKTYPQDPMVRLSSVLKMYIGMGLIYNSALY